MKLSIKSIFPVIATLMVATPLSQSLATENSVTNKIAVKTSVVEVNGVREIEAGNYQRGIRISEAALAKASVAPLRKHLLDNLCVATLAVGNMQHAHRYCNEAVNTGHPTSISHNNRAAMHYMSGNFAASLDDLEIAGVLGSFAKMVEKNTALVSKKTMLSSQ